ncbi:hypothetical protein BOX15_Mlig003710g1 [Macrostomum lignano]|uniref:OB domain-containing protein n=1 Tax=Macrostomum lignano TaxID=282301 RepID=A0A267F0W1_9PLAT|nr:hypothetical protein BOX15_Mlig003710g1 [Macrostomum lignano]
MLLSPLSAAVNQLSRRVGGQSVVSMATAVRLLCSGSKSAAEQSEPEDPSSIPESKQSPSSKKFRYSFLGGDHNEISLVGTVTKVTEKERNKSTGAEPYCVLSVVTLHRYKDRNGRFHVINSHHRVSSFNSNIIRIARLTNPGDRIFVVGRLEYFFVNQQRVATLTPTRMVPMLPKTLNRAQDLLSANDLPATDQDDEDGYEYQFDAEHKAESAV